MPDTPQFNQLCCPFGPPSTDTWLLGLALPHELLTFAMASDALTELEPLIPPEAEPPTVVLLEDDDDLEWWCFDLWCFFLDEEEDEWWWWW